MRLSIDYPWLAEPAMAGMLGQPSEFGSSHVDQRLVIAGLEIDVRLLLKRVVDDCPNSVADRRDRFELAIAEQLADRR